MSGFRRVRNPSWAQGVGRSNRPTPTNWIKKAPVHLRAACTKTTVAEPGVGESPATLQKQTHTNQQPTRLSAPQKLQFPHLPHALIVPKGPHMTSAVQLEANRRNAQSSTGPVTAAGKQTSSRNAFQHGLTSKLIVLPHENAADFESLQADLIAEYSPTGVTEQMLVHELTVSWWRLCRARRVEMEVLTRRLTPVCDGNLATLVSAMDPFVEEGDSGYRRVLRYLNAAERAWRRALSQLQQTQHARKKEEARVQVPQPVAQNGFVSQTSAQPAPPPRSQAATAQFHPAQLTGVLSERAR